MVKTEGILARHHVKPQMRSQSTNVVATVARSRFDDNLMFAQTVLCCLEVLRHVARSKYIFADIHASSTALYYWLQSVLPFTVGTPRPL